MVLDPGAVGGRALAAIFALGMRHNMPVFESALFSASPARQLSTITALERMRNVESLTLLQKAAREHTDVRVREAAKRASRTIFSVEGDEP